MSGEIIKGYHGTSDNPCEILVYYDESKHVSYYVCEGETNVNVTLQRIERGVNIDDIDDVDFFNWDTPIDTIEELIEAVEF